MRRIGTIAKPDEARRFSHFLKGEEIGNTCEEQADGCDIWIIDEEDVERAQQWFKIFNEDPSDPRFPKQVPLAQTLKDVEVRIAQVVDREGDPKRKDKTLRRPPPREGMGWITTVLLGLCIFLYLFTFIEPKNTDAPARSLEAIYPPTFQLLMYDFPSSSFNVWPGIYDSILIESKNPGWEFEGELFTKIRQGEIWRLFSPCLLHGSIFHIVFNLLWLIVLGAQMEQRTGFWKYLLFVLIVGIASNTGQYLVSGFNFLGLSGVVCGMFGFIAVRQAQFPWEGYRLHPSTVMFILIYIGGLFFVQALSFFAELYGFEGFSLHIANSAHVIGLAVGSLFGTMAWFRSS